MDASVGDTVYITFHNGQDMMDSIDLEITGQIKSPDPQVNSSTVFIGLDEAVKFLNKDSVTDISVKTLDYRKYETFGKDLIKSLPGYGVCDWAKLGEDTVVQAQSRVKDLHDLPYLYRRDRPCGHNEHHADLGLPEAEGNRDHESIRNDGRGGPLSFHHRRIHYRFPRELFRDCGGYFTLPLSDDGGIEYNGYFINTTNISGFNVTGIVKSRLDFMTIAGAFITGIVFSAAASWYPAKKTMSRKIADSLRANI